MKKPASTSAPESFLPLKPNWFHILLSLSAEPLHGYAIVQQVLERTNNKVHLWPATLYGTLKRLMDADLIEESPDTPSSDARRIPYKLTKLGGQVLHAESERLEDLVRVLHAQRGLKHRRTES